MEGDEEMFLSDEAEEEEIADSGSTDDGDLAAEEAPAAPDPKRRRTWMEVRGIFTKKELAVWK